MTAHRRWPKPPDGAIHLIGDTHFGATSMTANRKALWTADLDSPMLPESVLHVQVGDLVDHGDSAEDTEAVAFMDTHFGAGRWIAAVGNHDLYGTPQRTPEDAAAAWGMPAGNFVRDLGWAQIIVLAPDDGIEGDGATMLPFTETRMTWLDDQLVAAGDTPCLIVCHWSLYDTVGTAEGSGTGASTPGFYALEDSDVRAVLADNANAKAWLSGHTHSELYVPDLVKGVTVGGHTLCAVNASAVSYTGNSGDNLTSPQHTMYVTVTDGQIDVRFRNHGAGRWDVAGPGRAACWSVTL